jgi:putative transcriptional regulator
MDKRQKVIAGLREAISFAKGDGSRARVTQYRIPESIDVKKLRERLGMSQPEFALKFGFSLATVRQWEQGRRSPEGPSRVLLTVIRHQADAVADALDKEARQKLAAMRRISTPKKRRAAVA